MILIRCTGVELPATPTPPEWVHILPYGTWKGHHSGVSFTVDLPAAEGVVANFRARGVDAPMDWEHATNLAGLMANRAPAAAFLDQMEVRADGVWAHVRGWTVQGAADVVPGPNGELPAYRYLSPVVDAAAKDGITGRPVGMRVMHVALTNVPFFGGALRPILGSLGGATHVAQDLGGTRYALGVNGDGMLLGLLVAALGMPEATTEEVALEEVKRLKALDSGDIAAKAQVGTALCSALSIDAAAALLQVPQLVGRPTHDQLLDARRATASATAAAVEESDEVILAAALEKGLITPAMKAEVAVFLTSNRLACRAYLAKLEPIAGLGGVQAGGNRSTPNAAALSDDERRVATALRLSDAEFIRSRS